MFANFCARYLLSFCTFTMQNGQNLKLAHFFFLTVTKKTCKFLFNIVRCWIHHMIFKFAILSNHTMDASFSFLPFHCLKSFSNGILQRTHLALKMKRKISPTNKSDQKKIKQDMWFEQVRCNEILSIYEIIAHSCRDSNGTHFFFWFSDCQNSNKHWNVHARISY